MEEFVRNLRNMVYLFHCVLWVYLGYVFTLLYSVSRIRNYDIPFVIYKKVIQYIIIFLAESMKLMSLVIPSFN